MKPKHTSRLVFPALILAGSLAAPFAQAADFAWDPANDATGGTNTWDASSTFWDSGTSATGANTNIAWTNGVTNNAYFAGTAGTVTLGGNITAGSLIFGTAGYILNTGTNTLTLNAANTGTAATINFDGAGTLALVNDGDGTGAQQNIDFLEHVSLAANGTISVGRLTNGVGSLNAANKTLQLGNLSIGANTLTVNNNNGYGLQFAGTTTLSDAATFNVNGGSNAAVVQGLTLSGVVSGGFGFTKSGAGTLVLGSASNSFGSASTINITGGLVSIAADGALGDASNLVSLNASGAGLQFTGTNTYAHQINTSTAGGVLDVSAGAIANLTAAFNGGVASANAFTKTGNGILKLSADNNAATPYTGVITISAGAIRVSNAGALGAAANNTVVSNFSGAAVQIDGVSTAEAFNISNSGINTGGAIENFSGTNDLTGLITLANAATIGSTSGTLNIKGGIAAGANALTYAGAGNITIGTTAITGTTATQTKIGSGTLTISNVNPLTGNININAGTLALNSAATLAGNIAIAPAATLSITDDSVSPTNNRLTGKTVSLNGGVLNYVGSTTGNSAETTGALTVLGGHSVVTVTAQTGRQADLNFNAATVRGTGVGGTVLFRGSSLGTAAGAGIATIKSGTGGFTFIGQTGAANTTTKGILPWALVDTTTTGLGTSFATADTATGILRPLNTGTEMVTNAFTSNTNMRLTTGTLSPTAGAGTGINSLTITGGAITMAPTVTAPTTLTLGSGGLLATVSSSISGGALVSGNQFNVFTPGSSTVLTISSAVSNGTGGFTKAGTGTLELTSVSGSYAGYSANTIGGGTNFPTNYIEEGILKLGANNALGGIGVGTGGLAHNALSVYAGATLDLNGKVQYIGGLSSQNMANAAVTVPGVITADGTADATTAGLIKSTTGAGTLYMTLQNSGNANQISFSGSIQGANVGIARVGQAAGDAFILRGVNTYGGPTLFAGGKANATESTSLRDDGRLTGTSGIDINFVGFTIDNTGLSNHADRVNDAAAIGLNGGMLFYQGRAQTASTETLGATTATTGISTLTVTPGGTGVNSADLTLTSLTRNSGAMLNFAGTNLGQIGNSPRILVTGANLSSIGGIIPGAVVNAADLAAYNATTGFGALGTVGYPAYASGTLSAAPTSANFSGNGAVAGSGGQTINALKATGGITFAAGSDTLTLASGMVIGGQALGTSGTRGQLTSSTSELFLVGGGTVNSVVTGTNKLVMAGGDTTLTAANVHTGGTTFNNSAATNSGNGAQLTLSGSGVTIPNATVPANGLVVNNSIVSMSNSAGQIGSSNIVTLNGSSIVNLFGNNTLAGLVINNIGGLGRGNNDTQFAIVNTFTAGNNTGSSGTLTLGASGITTTSSVMAVNTENSIIKGRLNLPSSTTLNIGATQFNGQIINPLIADLSLQGLTGGGGTITKSGDGVLQLNTAAVLTGTLDVTGGTLQTGAANAGARFANVTLQNGTRLNLNNADTLYGSLAGTSSSIVTNTGGLTGSKRTLTVGFSDANSTFAGSFLRFNDAAIDMINLNKIGAGTMTLTGNSSTASGQLTVNGGGVTFKDNGINNFLNGAVTVNGSSTLTLDNSGTANVNNRLANTAINLGLTLNGGNFNYIGRASTASSESTGTGGLTFGSGESTVTANEGATGGTSVVTFGGFASNAGSTYTFAGTNLGTATDKVFLTGQGNGTLLQRGAVGSDFAVYDTTLGVKAFTGYTTNANINSAAASNFKLDATTTTRNLTTALALNTLNITDNNVTLGTNGSLLPTAGLTLSSGAIIVNGANATINTPVLAVGGNEGIFRANNSGFNVASAITGTAGLTKTGTGDMSLSARQAYTGATTVNAGTLKLNSGLANTLLVVPTATTATLGALNVNGGSFDLNGQNQAVGSLSNNNALPGTGGNVINTGALTTFTSAAGGSSTTFAGQIGGGTNASPANNLLNFVKSGAGILTLTNANTYSGTTTIRGGGITLRDSGTLLSTNTSAIGVNFGTLTIDQSGLNPSGSLNPTRINAAAPLTLAGGTLALTSGGSVDSSATFNSLTLASGANTINANLRADTGTSNTLTLGNLVRSAGSTVHFANAIGQLGMNQAQVFLTQVNGVAPTNNSFLGPWAVVNNGDFAAYVTTQGVGAYGSGGFPAYGATLTTGTIANINVATTTIAANTAVGALRLGFNNTQAVNFTAGTEVLNIETGALLRSNNNNTTTIGASIGSGVLTAGATVAGTTELVAYANNNWTINSIIKDGKDTGFAGLNAAALVSLVKSGAGTLTLTAANAYTGGTVVNQGILTFTGATGTVVPGNLTINNATVTETAAGQIAAASDVTMNGGGTLTMVGTNTLKSLTFGNIAAASSVAGATSLTLSEASAITATNDNLNFTPTVSGTALLLTNAAPVISVSGSSPNGLSITAPITSAGGAISKTGTGSLVLTGNNSFATGVNLNAGALIVDHNSALGSGPLAIANGTALMSGTGVRTLNNLVSVAGNFTFGALTPDYGTAVANNGVILSNTVTLAAGAHQIAVDGLLNTSTISGKLTGGTNLTKAGPGTLVLSNAANDFGGTTTVTGGTLKSGVTNALTTSTDLSVSAGAAFDTGGFAQSLSTLSGAGLVSNSGGANTLTVGNSSPTNATFSGIITGVTPANMALTKVGTNTQTLSGTNTYAGATTVSAGILLLNGENTGGGLISVAAAGTLGGTGSTTAPINVTGVLSPGASIQSLASGALTMNNASTFFYEAIDNSATGADLMVVNGALSLTGVTLDLSMANLGGTWALGNKLTLISYTGAAITSGFTGFTDDATYTGGVFGTNQWVFDYNDALKGANYNGEATGSSFVTLTVIPEPDVAMLVGGLGLIALLRRRRA